MIAGAYTLDLYCDNHEWMDDIHDFDEFPHQFVSETKGECFRKARKQGWLINVKMNKVLCPKCSGKLKGKP